MNSCNNPVLELLFLGSYYNIEYKTNMDTVTLYLGLTWCRFLGHCTQLINAEQYLKI